MAISYKNFKKDIYYLHVTKSKKGNPRYYFSKSKNGKLVAQIPEGYEIYENPNAQVFLRKKMPQLILEEEIKIVEQSLKRNKSFNNYKLTVLYNILTIYLPDQDIEELRAIVSIFNKSSTKIEDILLSSIRYSPQMRFQLEDHEKRKYSIWRYYYGAKKEEWLYLDSSTNLEKLSKKYCYHLGKDSYFELQ
jgi:Lhr-like helicase